jgi:sec-independent protein translocase protein TatB
MFDIGFTELLVIGVVALLVIGPERLPKVARTAGHLFGRFQRYVSNVKADIGREMQLEELRKAGQDFKESVEQAMHGVENRVQEAEYTMREEVVSPVEEAAKSVAQADLFDEPARTEIADQAETLPAATHNQVEDAPDTKA